MTATDELAARVPPLPDLVQRLLEHGGGQVAHQAGVLGQRQERVGQQQAAGRVLPADERLDAADPQGPRVDLGLVEDGEPAGEHGVAQLLERAQPLLAPGRVAVGAVDAVAAAGRPWRGTSRCRPGAAGVETSRPCAGIERDADAGVDPHGDAVDGERRARATSCTRCATASALARRRRSARKIANSSPPEPGQQVARAARQSLSRSATSRSRSSPAWCPRLSLTSLNRSRSSSSSAPVAVGAHRPGARLDLLVEGAAVAQAGELVGQGELVAVRQRCAPRGR